MTAPLALTAGEPAGIGGEITLMAWRERVRSRLAPFFAIDDPARLKRLAARLGWDVPVEAIASPEDAAAVFARALPVLAQGFPAPIEPGRLDPANAPAVIAAIATGARLVLARRAAALVTNPIQKETLYQAGFPHPGHTEFLGELAGGMRPVMMLVSDAPVPPLRVVPVTVHVALKAALAALETGEIEAVGRIAADALARDFGIARPRLAVAGLNPHAGEHGTMGREEIDLIAPAIARLQRDGIDAFGPLSPDTLFHPAARLRYDAVLCMYHDQALIPLKTIDFDGGVNVTLGLPFVRTSPDHGTATDIAGTGTASPASLIAALRLAATMSERRLAAAATLSG
ncbi:MAG TPA: 4-hydroxythreonine-4-phosphate dehydrogenase PdxA [Stellaceae bacterium]|nr:4-hydroxythreonine-4-phosphate dehydrogenase PdxA [Stellaceae bacterium]